MAWKLTTNHPSSSYGKPVLVDDDGEAYGPCDLILTEDGVISAAELARQLAKAGELEDETTR